MKTSTRKRAEPRRPKTMDFEDLLEAVGSYGKFQRRLMWGFLIPISFTIPFLCMNQIFLMSTPSHRCHEPAVSSAPNLSREDVVMLTSPLNTAEYALTPYDSCSMYNLSYGDALEDLRASGMNVSHYVKTFSPNWTTVSCQHGWDYDKSLYWRTATTDWDLVCEDDYKPSFVYTMITVGSSIGTPAFGAISDKIGRKVSFLICSIIGVIMAVLTVVVPTFTLFWIVRLINGTLLPSVFQLPYLILVEIVSPEMRTRANGVACIGWTVGLALMPLLAWLTADWVYLGWLCAVASLPYPFYYWMLPESPRWLISQDKFEEANAVFQKIAKINGKDISDLDMIPLLKECAHKEKEEAKGSTASPLEVLKKPTLLRRFLFLTACWSADGMAYYGFHINVGDLYGNEFLNFFLLALVEFPSYVLTWYMMESRLGRRWSNVAFLFLAAVACILPVMEPEDSRTLTTVASLIGKFGVSASFMVMYQQAAEILPTTVRASGLGIAGTICNLISISTPYVIYLKTYGHHIPYTVMAFICFFAGLCALFIPETLNENLPQTVADGENFGKDRPFFSLANPKKPPPKMDVRDGSIRRMSSEIRRMSSEMTQFPPSTEVPAKNNQV